MYDSCSLCVSPSVIGGSAIHPRYAAAMPKTTREMVEEAAAFGIKVGVTTSSKATCEIVPLSGVRPKPKTRGEG